MTEGVYVDLPYEIETDKEGGFHVTRYGRYAVARAGNQEDAQRYVEWHKELMGRWKSHPIAQEVAGLLETRKRIADEIDDVLARLLVDGHIPGRCEGCP